MSSIVGSFTFVLHSHLPYVLSHGRWPHGTDWLNEATAETYIPLLDVFYQLVAEGVSPKVTLGITPILSEQLADLSFKEEFRGYLETKIQSAQEDIEYFTRVKDEARAPLANDWREYYSKILHHFTDKYHQDLIGAFRRLQEAGHIEIITCAATHGYLPLLAEDACVQAQIKQGVATYKRHYGRQPQGIWLPECAYRPRYPWKPPVDGEGVAPYPRKGVEEFLSENGIEYFLIDSHLLRGGKAIGVYLDRFEALEKLWGQFEKGYQPRAEEPDKNPYEIYLVSSSPGGKKPVAVFTRDPKTGLQVWSGEHGYPGNGYYLDFHKKHFPGGHRYWRVTDTKADLACKKVYEPQRIEEIIREQAGHFKEMAKAILLAHKKEKGAPGIITAPYDAELFGHWWFEGPRWIYWVLKWMSQDPELKLVTCGEYLDKNPSRQVISIPEGSWGEGGFHWIWINDWNSWTWKHIYQAEKMMMEIAREFWPPKDEKMEAIIKQLGRELLLLESSDWQFLISTWSARDYAEMRVSQHWDDFVRLHDMARKYSRGQWVDPGEWEFLGILEKRDKIFPEINPQWWARVEFPAD